MLEINNIYNMDCLKGLKELDDNSINLIVIDPPYSELVLEWDDFKDWKILKEEFNRLLKNTGQLYIFGRQPMLSEVYIEFKDTFGFRFELVWDKGRGYWNSNMQPMNSHELIWCFKKKGVKTSDIYFDIESVKVKGEPYVRHNKKSKYDTRVGIEPRTIVSDGMRFPLSILKHPTVSGKKGNYHPTQKPEEILEWIIKSSSKEEDLILDSFMGSGTTAVMCKKLNRNFVGFELNKEYYDKSLIRLNKVVKNNASRFF